MLTASGAMIDTCCARIVIVNVAVAGVLSTANIRTVKEPLPLPATLATSGRTPIVAAPPPTVIETEMLDDVVCEKPKSALIDRLPSSKT